MRFFDQICFYEVSAEALLEIRRKHPRGQYPVRIEETEFSLAEYQKLMDEHQAEIQQAKTRQQCAFEAERQRWVETGQANFATETMVEAQETDEVLADDEIAIENHIAGNIWQVLVEPGQLVKAGDVVMILEAMKMDPEVTATVTGMISSLCQPSGSQVHAGQRLMVIKCTE